MSDELLSKAEERRLRAALITTRLELERAQKEAAEWREMAERRSEALGKCNREVERLERLVGPVSEEKHDSVLGRCPHGVDLDREFCPQGCRV